MDVKIGIVGFREEGIDGRGIKRVGFRNWWWGRDRGSGGEDEFGVFELVVWVGGGVIEMGSIGKE